MTEQQTDQLSTEEKLRRLKLTKRVGKGEVHISPSNKGKGVVVMSLSMYEGMVLTHTKGDLEVTTKELEESQRFCLEPAL